VREVTALRRERLSFFSPGKLIRSGRLGHGFARDGPRETGSGFLTRLEISSRVVREEDSKQM
jgi:hypothetical protein